jgi:hypothetical protein
MFGSEYGHFVGLPEPAGLTWRYLFEIATGVAPSLRKERRLGQART